MILHDQYAMHRRWWDESWSPGPNDKDWTDWDYLLADVYQVIEDFTDAESGQWIPYDQSGDVYWETEIKFSGALAAVQSEDSEKLKPGESYYAVPKFRDPDNKPTLESWARDKQEGRADGRPPEARNSRPPTAAELKALRTDRIDE